MVALMRILVLLIAFSGSAFAVDVKVTAEIEQDSAYENQTLKGLITITRDRESAVDLQSFRMNGEKLIVESIRDVTIDPRDPTILSIYHFQLPGKAQGLYALPVVTVTVGGKQYQSTRSSYVVQAAAPAIAPPAPSPPPPMTTSAPPSENVLRLEASVDGKTVLFPGQRTRFVYHYYYSGNVALTEEQLPFLDAEGFLKIGEKEIKDYVQGSVSVREISQEVEAVNPGQYSFGPSVIEGYTYEEDIAGRPVYTSPKLTSEAPSIAITVEPFPEKSKPASFNGAVGQYTFQTVLLSPSEMQVGDEVSLALIVSGRGNIKSVSMADLCCQPGFSGFFRLSDLPPSEEVSGNTKKATFQMWVLTDQAKEIPSIEFSFFNPEISEYEILRSEPIPIQVRPGPIPAEERIAPDIQKPETKPPKVFTPAPIESESIFPLTYADLHNKPGGTWWSLAIVPLGILLVAYQVHLKDYMTWSRSQVRRMTSQELFLQAFSKNRCDFEILKKAFKVALVEARMMPTTEIDDAALPDQGLIGEVRSFFSAIDEARFAGKGKIDLGKVRIQAQELMEKIQKTREEHAPS